MAEVLDHDVIPKDDNDGKSPIDLHTHELISQLQTDIEKVKKQDDKEHRIILLSVDNSPISSKVIQWSHDHILRNEDIVVLFSIWQEELSRSEISDAIMETGDYVPVVPLPVNDREIHQKNKIHFKKAKNMLESMFHEHLENEKSGKKREKKDTHVLSLLVPALTGTSSGQIGELIVKVAEAIQADQCVVGSRGLSGLKSWLLGSVSKHVMENCRCPVTVVK